MKTYTGEASTLDDAIRLAADAAVAEIGPDAMVNFSLTEVRGVHGGIAGRHEIEADITVRGAYSDKLCKDASEYRAYQQKGVVTVLAYGQHSSAGYIPSLDLAPINIAPPQYILTHKEPTGPVAQVITSFVVSASFKWERELDSVFLEDGNGKQKVPVTQLGRGKK